MKNRLSLLGGLFTTIVGIVFFVNPPLAFRFPVNEGLILAAGATSGLLALIGVSTRMRTRRRRASPPEAGPTPAHPGADIEDALHTIQHRPHTDTRDEREAVFDRLAAVAIRRLEQEYGISAEEARSRLGRGEWTDDPEAAAFFATGPEDDAPFIERLKESFTDDSRFVRRARRAAAALDAMEDDT